jgi:hypothetical protein
MRYLFDTNILNSVTKPAPPEAPACPECHLGTRGLKKRLAIGGGGGAKFPFVSRRAGARSLE